MSNCPPRDQFLDELRKRGMTSIVEHLLKSGF
jgi:hypothetical protein